ncbi:NYN domain-containing protein [Chryseolinea sp. T2]|uniref:NYN domain-containing protein n=1 Tax=Chryseolinea sp. T2 TaxID=3129255 RepID=UPI003076A123
MKTTEDIRIAVLIDADNVPSANIKGMLEEIAKYGTPTFKRIYADWTKPNLTGWKSVLLENAITPIQQYGYTTGKNATDSAMIIDAMDILYSEKVDAFAIVSSDSDFTRLATRLREAGMIVIGLGERKTPNPFIVSCDKFIYLEILTPVTVVPDAVKTTKSESHKTEKRVTAPGNKPALQKVNKETILLIANSITDLADDTGWAFLGEVGNLIIKKQKDFDPRNFGYNKLGQMLKSVDKFEVDERGTDKKGIKMVYVRLKA